MNVPRTCTRNTYTQYNKHNENEYANEIEVDNEIEHDYIVNVE